VAFPLAAGALAVTVWTALFTVAATGHLTRWLAFRARLAPGTLAPAPVAAAAAASLIRLTLARRAGRRCLAARAALT
jgi:hypothetical protein